MWVDGVILFDISLFYCPCSFAIDSVLEGLRQLKK
jgi:hypothetical protein